MLHIELNCSCYGLPAGVSFDWQVMRLMCDVPFLYMLHARAIDTTGLGDDTLVDAFTLQHVCSR